MSRLKPYDLLKLYEEMSVFEKKAFSNGFKVVAGLDEAGRGPLAGPVVAGAIVLDPKKPLLGLRDSKKISNSQREKLFENIKLNAIAYSVGIVDHHIIDKINILQATKLAMKRAIESLSIKPDYILIDSVELSEISIPFNNFNKGESISVSVAGASIVAKVTRDRLMNEYARLYPDYGFEKHKGYGTAEHLNALREFGPSPIHRVSFKGVYCQHGEYDLREEFFRMKDIITNCVDENSLGIAGKEIALRTNEFNEREIKLLRKAYSQQKKQLG